MNTKLRSRKGMSLVMVISLGVVATLWMIGTAAVLLPTFQRITANRTNDVMRDGAELALDWALAQVNSPSTRAALDASPGQSKTSSVPNAVLPASMQSYSASVTVSNTNPPNYSYLYSPNFTGTAIIGISGFRVVTATFNSPGGTLHKSVQVILMPTYNVSSTSSTITSTSTSIIQGPPQYLFSQSMASPGTITFNGGGTTNSYDSSISRNPSTFDTYGAGVWTNSSLTFNGNGNNVGGTITVANSSSGGNATGSATAYNNNVSATGNVSSGITTSGTVTSSDSNLSPMQFDGVPSAPSTSTNIGPISLQGSKNNTITLANGYWIDQNGVRTSTAGGDFVTNGISMQGSSAQIIVDNSNGPVNLYVQGSGSNNGITIAGNGISNSAGIPGDFRIWYGGTGTVKVAGNGATTGVIYAPSAPFQMSGNGGLYGAVVANSISMSNNTVFHYDRQLAKDNTLVWYPPLVVTTQQSSTVMVHNDNFNHFQAVSWYEF